MNDNLDQHLETVGLVPQVLGHGYIGATPNVNYSINTADGSDVNALPQGSLSDYSAAVASENELHARKMSVIKKKKSQQLEMKRHLGALSLIDKKYGMYQNNNNFIGSVKNHADGNYRLVHSNASGSSSSSSSSDSTGNTSNTGSNASNAGSSAAPAKKGFFSNLLTGAENLLNTPAPQASTNTTANTPAVTPAATPAAAASNTILGMPQGVFYAVLAVVVIVSFIVIAKSVKK